MNNKNIPARIKKSFVYKALLCTHCSNEGMPLFTMHEKQLIIRNLGMQPYGESYEAMHAFADNRSNSTQDELWLLEHPPVFTQGKNGAPEHLLKQTDIPVIQTDRGGQITYHGPGQQIVYVLIDMKRAKVTVRQVVSALENCVIATLASYNIESYAKKEAPGVYVNGQKICSLGLRICGGCTLHGLALNVNMDLTPFELINPCGYSGLSMTQISAFVPVIDRQVISQKLVQYFAQQLEYDHQFI